MVTIEYNIIRIFFININDDEYQKITENLKDTFQSCKLETIEDAIKSMKDIKFQEVLVLMNEGIEKEFIDSLKRNLKYI